MSQWICSKCFKSFKRKGDLTRHSHIHQGNPTHKCTFCGKTFYQFSGLKTHRNVHTGAKPFKCHIGSCQKAFGDPSSCSRHKKEIHGGGSVYRCPSPDCRTSIKRRSVFGEHLRSKHGWHKTDNLDAFIEPFASNSKDTEYASIQDATPLKYFLLEPLAEAFRNCVENKSEFSTLGNTISHLKTESLCALSDYSPLSTPVHSPATTPAPPSTHSEHWMMEETNPWVMHSTDPYATPWPIPHPYIADETYHLVSAVELDVMSWLTESSVLPTPFLSFVSYGAGPA